MPYYNEHKDPYQELKNVHNDFDINLKPATYSEWIAECAKLTALKQECVERHLKARDDRDKIVKEWRDYVRNIADYRKTVFGISTPCNPKPNENTGSRVTPSAVQDLVVTDEQPPEQPVASETPLIGQVTPEDSYTIRTSPLSALQSS